MSEPTIQCPHCKTEIRLTESLAAPLLESARRQNEQWRVQREAEFARRESELQGRHAKIEQQQVSLENEIAARVQATRAAIAAEEARKARDATADELNRVNQEKRAAEALLRERDAKLAEAHRQELAMRQEHRQFQEDQARFELDKQRALDAERGQIREKARIEVQSELNMVIAEKDLTISSLKDKLQDTIRRAEAGSQQLQGEVQELALEGLLRAQFSADRIDPVPKGEFGGDVLHQVRAPTGQLCGLILWESKRTRNWSDSWLTKLRDDARAAGAALPVIVSQALPKGVDTFHLIDGVWVTSFKCAMALAVALRQSLIDVAAARTVGEGLQTRMEQVYHYLTSPKFRHYVEAIVEKVSDMQDDLEKERKNTQRLWAKREQQIRGVVDSTVIMYGDLQGIVGRPIPEIDALSATLLESK